MVFPFQQVLKMGSILISGLFIIREHQDFCTLFTMHCFLNLIHAWNLHSLPCPEWYEMLTNEWLTAESDVTVETPSYKIKHWALLILKILPHHPLFCGFWDTFPTFSCHLKYFFLLLKLEVLHWNPWQSLKSSTRGSRGEEPLEIVYTQIWMLTWGGHFFFSIFSTSLRSLKFINHCHKSFLSLSFPGFSCYLEFMVPTSILNLSEIRISIPNWLFGILIKLNQHFQN